MDPTLQNTDLNQVSPSISDNSGQAPMSPAMGQAPNPAMPTLSPQQRMQMMQYAQGLMNPNSGPPAHTIGSGLSEMARALTGGYLDSQATPMQNIQNQPTQISPSSPSSSNILNGLFGGGTTQ